MEKLLLLVLLPLFSSPIATKTIVSSSYQVREPRQESCWELISRGRRLHQDYVTRSVSVKSLAQCQKECEDVLFNCETISFGYDRFRNATCDLSDWDAASLSTRQTFANEDTADSSNSVIYSRFGSDANKRCSVAVDAVNTQPSDTAAPAKLYPSSNPYEADKDQYNVGSSEVCYTLVGNSRRLAQRYVERSVSVISLDECKILCTRETTFDCRSFNFRRRLSSVSCDLSREDSTSVDLVSSHVFLSDPESDYYERTSRGNACFQQYNKPSYYPPGLSFPATYPGGYPPLSSGNPTGIYPKPGYGENEGCFRRIKSGYRLEERIVRTSLQVRTQAECEQTCNRVRGFVCQIFSFKIPVYLGSAYGNPYNNWDSSNCHLSTLESRNLDPVRHLVLDRDTEIYERSQDWRDCREKNDVPLTNSPWANRPSLTSQCFQRLRSGIRMERRMVRFSLSVRTPRECEQECLNARYFTCRGFSYRYSQSGVNPDVYHKDYDNCDLTDTDMNLADPARDFIDDRNYDTWRKSGTGRDCEISVAAAPDTTVAVPGYGPLNQGNSDPWSRPSLPDQIPQEADNPGCYTRYRGGYRLDTRIVRDSTNVRTLAECELECSKSRFNCAMFSFRFSNRNGGYGQNPNNCELSDVTVRDLDRYRDMIEDRDYETFSKTQNTRHCNFKLIGDKAYGLDTLAGSPSYIHNAISATDDVTVGGFRCRPGSRCHPNPQTGHWYCETDDEGSWDYCCKPSHPCGYTEGFAYPWCYVGTDVDSDRLQGSKWRPCSERYAERPYAYLHRESPPNNTAMADILQSIQRIVANTTSPFTRSSIATLPVTDEPQTSSDSAEELSTTSGANPRQALATI